MRVTKVSSALYRSLLSMSDELETNSRSIETLGQDVQGKASVRESQEKREWERRPRKCPDKNGDKWELERIKRGWMEKVSIRNKKIQNDKKETI